jgi:serine protease
MHPRFGFVTEVKNWKPRLMPAVMLLLFLAACGGGEGDAAGGAGLAPGLAAVAGSVHVAAFQTLEREGNDSLSTAQPVGESAVVYGAAGAGDPGLLLSSGEILADLFALSTAGPVQAVLSFAGNEEAADPLGLLLLDAAGVVIARGAGEGGRRLLSVPAAGDYFLGVRALAAETPYALALAPAEACDPAALAEVVPGEILVRFKEGTASSRGVAGPVRSAGLETDRTLSSGATLMRLAAPEAQATQAARSLGARGGGKSVALRALTLEKSRRLGADPNVEYAEPNFFRRPCLLPNDQSFPEQWHYQLVNLPQAWDISVGSEEVVVAVIDSGILYHPDFRNADGTSRLFGGFDFVSDRLRAGDGDGIDPDPTDPGDGPLRSSSYHGTHVAGTIGAATNNGLGVAGVSWRSRIMPVRALGPGGGSDADIAEAIRYAAGLPNISGQLPPEGARIINMSLGGAGSSRTMAEAVAAARRNGVILVAAAGNDNVGTPFYPAGYPEVVCVSAVGPTAQKATYSNYGDWVRVAGPGGAGGAGGVLSTVGAGGYGFYSGTSMAAPHVSGILALMLAVNPRLTPDDIDLLFAGTHPEAALPLVRDLGPPGWDRTFGYGLIDAPSALRAAGAVTGGTATAPPLPYPTPVPRRAYLAEGGVDSGETGELFVVALDPDTLQAVGQTSTDASRGYAFRFEDLPAGEYFLAAGTDRNGDGRICDPEDACGFSPDRIQVADGEELGEIELPLAHPLLPADGDLLKG